MAPARWFTEGNRQATIARLLKHVSPEPNTGCWLWTGALWRHGYGFFYVGGSKAMRRNIGAHRAAFELFVGPIESGLVLDHLCRVPCCVNPQHLEAVTQRENLMRGKTVTARNAAATSCPSGHAYDEANTRRGPYGRRCRVCDRERHRADFRRSA